MARLDLSEPMQPPHSAQLQISRPFSTRQILVASRCCCRSLLGAEASVNILFVGISIT